MRYEADGTLYTDDQAEDLNLPSPCNTKSSTKLNALKYGTYNDTISSGNDSKSHLPETLKTCKALTGDCNCSKCYDSSGFYWGWINIEFILSWQIVEICLVKEYLMLNLIKSDTSIVFI